MTHNDSPIRILLWTEDLSAQAQWVRALAELCGELYGTSRAEEPWMRLDGHGAAGAAFDPAEIPQHLAEVDVLVTDAAERPAVYEPQSGVGLITWAPAQWGEVVLPDDASPRELRLACRLLAEIVRLRREKELTELSRDVLEDLAQRDPLTHLDNRRGWELAIERLQGEDLHAPLCVALLDLDFFKQVNDTCGHGVGDDVLQSVAVQLLRNVRDHDTVARLGGDEYGVLLPGVEAEFAAAVVERIRKAASIELPAGGTISASAGYALGRVVDVEQLTDKADKALQRAKRQGRERTEGY
jgi:diguanylate cyclase (GGDEF)-like protein